MKVIETLQATGPDGEVIDLVKPTEMKWYEGDSLIHATSALTTALAASTDHKFVKSLSIRIEF